MPSKKAFSFLFFPLFLLALLSASLGELLFVRQEREVEQEHPAPPPDLDYLFSRPLSLIGIGSQCLVFSHEEIPLVLKICKANRYQLPFLLEKQPFFSLEKRKQRKLKKKSSDFRSYQIAYTDLPQETGVLFLHLGRSNLLHKNIRLRDPLGFIHTFSADDLLFYIQKKAAPLAPYLLSLSKQGERQEIRRFFSLLFDQVHDHCQRGLRIKDLNPQKNLGVFDKEPLWIDPGRIIETPKLQTPSEQRRLLTSLYNELLAFVQTLSPNLSTELKEVFDKKIQTIDP